MSLGKWLVLEVSQPNKPLLLMEYSQSVGSKQTLRYLIKFLPFLSIVALQENSHLIEDFVLKEVSSIIENVRLGKKRTSNIRIQNIFIACKALFTLMHLLCIFS